MTGLFTKIAAAITALTLLGTNPGTALDNLNGLVQQPGDTAFVDSEELTAPVDPIALCKSIPSAGTSETPLTPPETATTAKQAGAIP